MAIKEILEGNTSKVLEATELLKELGDREGQFVWKKFMSGTITLTQVSSANSIIVLQVSSDNLDLSQADASWFVGCNGTYSANGKTYKWEITSATDIVVNNGNCTFTYDSGNAQIIITTPAFGDADREWSGCVVRVLEGYVVADDPNAYPNGDFHTDGYWYELVKEGIPYTGANPLTIGEAGAAIPANTLLEEALQILNGVQAGVSGIDFGTVTTSSKAKSVTVKHNLNTTPSWVALIPKSFAGSSNTTICVINGMAVYYQGSHGEANAAVSKSSTSITFNAYNPSSTPFKNATYYWFAIA